MNAPRDLEQIDRMARLMFQDWQAGRVVTIRGGYLSPQVVVRFKQLVAGDELPLADREDD